jgi:hypothetical protein
MEVAEATLAQNCGMRSCACFCSVDLLQILGHERAAGCRRTDNAERFRELAGHWRQH